MPRRDALFWTLLLASLALTGACTIRDDKTRPNQLDSLRVLGIRAEPADLVSGETATLSALVYEPDSNAVSYQWSWCPWRSGAEDGYTCALEEADLLSAWEQMNTGSELPPYDLGTAQTAAFEHVVTDEQAYELCVILSVDEEDRDIALFRCLSGLGLSIQLQVRANGEEITALKTIPAVNDKAERNTNPEIPQVLSVNRKDDQSELAVGEPLVTRESYTLRVEVAPDQSETFQPKTEPGLDPPDPRGESLFMSWFVTLGSTHRDGDQRTGYIDGETDFEDLLENTWRMPYDFEGDEAQLFVVLRDERNGVSWAAHSFTVSERQ